MKRLKLLLFPFAVIYDVATRIRNVLYDRGYKPVAKFDLPVIGIGNLAIGGTGKTPMVEYLIRLFNPQLKVATLSRGYGRKTKGFRIADVTDNASTVGDEPYLIHKKFYGKIVVAVGEERALAIPGIIHEHPDVQVILLDDAFQHRKVLPSFQIVLTDCRNLFYDDFLLPTGRLRESARGIQRADAVVVTKCPFGLKEDVMMEIEKNIRTFTDKPIFFAGIRYGMPVPLAGRSVLPEKVVLVSGIASHHALENYVKSHYNLVRHFDFADHYVLKTHDLQTICALAEKENASVLMTEKDAVKLDVATMETTFPNISFYYLPIETEFLKNGKDFDEMLLNAATRFAG